MVLLSAQREPSPSAESSRSNVFQDLRSILSGSLEQLALSGITCASRACRAHTRSELPPLVCATNVTAAVAATAAALAAAAMAACARQARPITTLCDLRRLWTIYENRLNRPAIAIASKPISTSSQLRQPLCCHLLRFCFPRFPFKLISRGPPLDTRTPPFSEIFQPRPNIVERDLRSTLFGSFPSESGLAPIYVFVSLYVCLSPHSYRGCPWLPSLSCDWPCSSR